MRNRILYLVLFSFLSSAICYCQSGYEKLSDNDKTFLDTLQYKTFLYFINEVNPENGLVKDRSTKTSPASTAAVGFAIPIWAIGAEHKWISKEKAAELTIALLRFLNNSKQSADALATGYKGLYYHFLDMKTGERYWNCELSTIDTGLLIAGIRFAAQYYDGKNSTETEIRKLADEISYRVNWGFTKIPDTTKTNPGAISMSWDPKEGLGESGWVGYNEALIMYIVAAGSGFSGAEKGYSQWLKTYELDEPYKNLKHIIFPPLFGHQYSHMFVDFKGIYDGYNKKAGFDYFENSRRATYTQYEYFKKNPNKWEGYDSLCWGLTACDGPGYKYNSDGRVFYDYAARGTSGEKHTDFDDGTIAPTAAAGSIVFTPEIVIPALKNIYEKYGKNGLWGEYGFRDAFNPTIKWYDSDYLAIDEGPIAIMIENYKNGFVWQYCMKDKIIKKGLKELGFIKR
jgi:hypothetical protein